MKLLLHICCAPCSIMCIETLRGEGIEPVGFWDNPNIHPFTEFRMRRNTLVDYAKEIGLSLVVEGGYGLRPFLEAVGGDFDGRCPVCYRLRMRSAARYAAENGFTHFTTTLLISPYQNHELLAQTAREAAEEFGVLPRGGQSEMQHELFHRLFVLFFQKEFFALSVEKEPYGQSDEDSRGGREQQRGGQRDT